MVIPLRGITWYRCIFLLCNHYSDTMEMYSTSYEHGCIVLYSTIQSWYIRAIFLYMFMYISFRVTSLTLYQFCNCQFQRCNPEEY